MIFLLLVCFCFYFSQQKSQFKNHRVSILQLQNCSSNSLSFGKTAVDVSGIMGASIIHRGSEGQPGKTGAATESTPASMYSPNQGKLKEKAGGGQLHLSPQVVLSHVICFGQWDNSKHDASRGLKDAYAVGLAFSFAMLGNSMTTAM